MGFFDIVGDLLDIGTDIVTLPFKVVGAAVETANDIGETISQDVKNKVSGTPDAPIRTSYDIRNEADKIIEAARKDFYKAKDSLDSSWNKISRDASTVANKRQDVYAMLGRAISGALAELPPQQSTLLYPSNAPQTNIAFDVGTFLGTSGTSMRMEAAEDYLMQANEYRCEVRGLINEVNSLKRTVLNVADAQKEELAMLDIIREAYQAKSKTVLTQSAELLHEIAVLCVQEIGENTNSKYRDLIQQLKQLWY